MQSGIALIDVWEIRWELQVWKSVWMIMCIVDYCGWVSAEARSTNFRLRAEASA